MDQLRGRLAYDFNIMVVIDSFINKNCKNMNLTLLTASICALCVVYALSIWIPFHISSIALRKALKNVQGIDQNSMPGRLWEVVQLYCKTFKGGNSYTTEYSGDYITVEALAAKYNINLRVVNSSPNILTSIGILGTFIGLTLALFHFDSGSTESIRESINSLLSGMSTAFLTSVFGMLTSSIFLFCERRLLNKIGNAVSAYTSELDATYHATNDQVLVDALSFVDVNGAIHTPGSVMSAISNNMAAVQNEIQNLGNNIAASITDALDKEFDNKLVPIIEGLAQKLENPAQAITDKLIKELGEVCDNFKNSLTESVNQQMDELLEKFIDASNAINTIPDTIDAVSKNILDSSDKTVKANEQVARSIEEQSLRLNDIAVSFAESLVKLRESADSIADIHDSLADMPASLNSASNAITQSTSALSGTNAQISSAIDSVQKANDTTRDSIKTYSDEIKSIEAGLQSIFNQINDGLKQYADTAKDGLQTMLDPFTTSISTATEKVANCIAPLADAVDELSTFEEKVSAVIAQLEMALKPFEKNVIDLSKKSDKFKTGDNN